MKVTKKKIISAMEAEGGIITQVSSKLGVSRSTLYRHFAKNPEVWHQIKEEIEQKNLDETEIALRDQIKAGNIAAIIFHLKCKGKSRGYIEQQNINFNQSHDGRLRSDYKEIAKDISEVEAGSLYAETLKNDRKE